MAHHNDDLQYLYQMFGTYTDPNTIARTLKESNNNLEVAYNKLNRSIKLQQEVSAQARVPPERKMAFLTLAFDKLDPTLIRNALVRYNWSVDGALDDILKAEEERNRILELKRQKEEEERRRREAEQLKYLEQQRVIAEQRSKVTFLQSMFPHLPEGFIAQQLQNHNWNPDSAFGLLEAAETRARQDEERMYQEQQRRVQMEAEEQRLAEMRAFEREAEKAVHQNLDNLLQCANWDEVSKLVEVPAKEDLEDIKPTQRAFVKSAIKLLPNTDEAAATRAILEAQYDVDKALLLLHAKSFQKAMDKLVGIFGDVPKEVIQSVLVSEFPDEQAAMVNIQPEAQDWAEEKVCLQALEQAENLLREAQQRLSTWQAEKTAIMASRAERRRQLQAATSPEERNFIQIVDEMKTPQEDMQIKANEDYFAQEMQKRLKQVEELKGKVQAVQKRRADRAKGLNSANRKLSPQELHSKFQKLYAEEMAKEDEALQIKHAEKQSIVADRLRAKIGDTKFAQLQEAMGRAPGGKAGVPGRKIGDVMNELRKQQQSRSSMNLSTAANQPNQQNIPSQPNKPALPSARSMPVLHPTNPFLSDLANQASSPPGPSGGVATHLPFPPPPSRPVSVDVSSGYSAFPPPAASGGGVATHLPFPPAPSNPRPAMHDAPSISQVPARPAQQAAPKPDVPSMASSSQYPPQQQPQSSYFPPPVVQPGTQPYGLPSYVQPQQHSHNPTYSAQGVPTMLPNNSPYPSHVASYQQPPGLPSYVQQPGPPRVQSMPYSGVSQSSVPHPGQPSGFAPTQYPGLPPYYQPQGQPAPQLNYGSVPQYPPNAQYQLYQQQMAQQQHQRGK